MSTLEILRSSQDPSEELGRLIHAAFSDGLLDNVMCERRSCRHQEKKIRTETGRVVQTLYGVPMTIRRNKEQTPIIWVMTGKGEVRTLMGAFECPRCKGRARRAIASVKL